ncbi:hypothetical protein [Nocardioides perillae]|uniref:Uncharacterized protein n=1 Tax=Nocardioides perillae TaxID=1119534 RepID=A0A7Y9RSH4_9ACTN|nr:hypothetical protein [Nocardioides perillae]NYG55570.1 hypothetical protein [Nocardioides perillae]
MEQTLSRLAAAGTAGYAVYALAAPGHLADALEASGSERDAYDLLAQAFGVRDLAISGLALLGRSARTVRTAQKARIACDLGDAVLLSRRVDDPDLRRKVLAVTVGWASLNALALVLDGRRSAA